MRKSGHADLPLHTGTVPKWLADRMMTTGTLIIEALVMNYGRKEALVRLSDPLWFQSFGAVMGMDWHSSGITTSVMYALKRGLNPRARDLGICVCGGRGKYSRKTPEELQILAGISNLDGDALIKASKLSAKVDNTAVQDGFQLYQHNFIVTCDGDWAVVQQGMNVEKRAARRYHWCSDNLRLFSGSASPSDSFLDEPHTGVTGENKGDILNLTASDADKTRSAILTLSKEEPSRILKECAAIFNSDGTRNAVLPVHHEVRKEDVNTKRLGAVLATAYEKQPEDFSSLLLTEGLGPRTLQSLTLVSEVIYGTPSRFTDPARFSFAHGGKDGHPFPVPLKIYDESIRVLQDSIEKSKLGYNEKSECIRKLHSTALRIEEQCEPDADFDAVIEREHRHSKEWGGKTVGD
jgi:hypothetical protein